ncbi:hypothetical protein [Microbacterium arabinogalactanolyticum]|uniref:hypothetical protein n=1 Tax=Microbacterium arabinogalactanolyticum TaxID=69365 RepID=UPI002554978F|nr:hypothetical protein [Microbacterium arabinogalactanolyticum]GLC85346.1 hypothetical protein MIAR_19330 [Microbacterium arabinogalactanolyticum]
MTIENTNVSRRTLVKGAAWSLPVVAVAAATPLAAASTANASLAWTDSSTSLLALRVLDSASVITATALVTVPTQYTITNGAGAITDNATVTITVNRPAGINLTLGSARGFGVYSVDGIATAPGERTATYNTLPVVGNVGFPLTTWTGTRPVSIASNGALAVPVEFGLAGTNTGVSVSALATFPVNLSVKFSDGSTYTADSTISVPVGAGIL